MDMPRLVDTVIDDLLIFAYCEDVEIEPDFAIEQLERIADREPYTPTNGIGHANPENF